MTTQTPTKYTLGPWHARGPSQPDNTGGRDWCVLDDDGKIIAECFEHVGFSDDRKTYAVRPAEANAHLISTAPEMLEALDAVTKCFFESEDGLCAECGFQLGITGLCQSCATFSNARAAIRKAKGEL